MNRYARQIAVADIGASGQDKLARARVLVVGAGGLGCPVLSYLAGAGIGQLVIVDPDSVDVTNLHRQPLYAMSDIGKPKAEAARDALLRFNPEIRIDTHQERVTPSNARALVMLADIVVDAADSLAVTYTLSDACMIAKKALVSASVIGLSGYAGVFCKNAPSYRAVFPDLPQNAGSCAENGVLGSAVAVIGALQANLALHEILQLQPSAAGRLVSFDAKRMTFGGFDFAAAQEPEHTIAFISAQQVCGGDIVIDVRPEQETPILPFAHSQRVDPADIESFAQALPRQQRAVICCRSGMRATAAANRLRALGFENIAVVAMGNEV